MSEKKNGGPAFPSVLENVGERSVVGHDGEAVAPGTVSYYSGLSMRDYFAAQALVTVTAYASTDVEHWHAHDFAQHAYNIADAMLAARESDQ